MSEQTNNETTETTNLATASNGSSDQENIDQNQTTNSEQDTQQGEQSSSGIASAIKEDDESGRNDNESDSDDSTISDNVDNGGDDDKSNSDNNSQDSEDDLEYEIELSENSPLTQKDLDLIAEFASENNLTKAQVDDIIKNREEIVNYGINLYKSQQAQEYKKLNEEFLKAPEFNDENRKESFAAIQRAVKTYGDEDLEKALSNPVIGNNVALGKFLKKIGDLISPEDFEGMKPSTRVGQKESSDPYNDRMKKLYPDFFKEK